MKDGTARIPIRRDDYTPYPWRVEGFQLRFDIGHKITTVTTEFRLSRSDKTDHQGDIVLDGQGLELVSVALDGRLLELGEYAVDASRLVIHHAHSSCTVKIEVRIRPYDNTALEGLYPSGEFLLTQCEAEGFRNITYFPDRPDVMTGYDVSIFAEKSRFPVLLSNGNLVDSGDLEDGRHWVRWVDPHNKPCYLFALVAGDLEFIEDQFKTRSGRVVTLRVYVEKQNLDKCDHAMESLVKSMIWDEERFDLEYDLDIYNIVATDDFNMGAMENKSLNIFNSKYVLAKPESATDDDFQAVEGVIGHEYFHNWTGNRVTCQDWFQLTLKEGLTVFRDQEFSSDMQSRAVNRVRDVRDLRNRQFPEDAGPMSHPIRPDQYLEINNFYTMTVYQKGATIIRMYHTLLGEEGFQKGMKLYFQRHDGQAVTCDDFLAAMADANNMDLEKFGQWYSQSGTPVVTVRTEYDPGSETYTLHLSQHTPPTHDQETKIPLLIPFAFGLLSQAGEQMTLTLAGEEGTGELSQLLILEDEEHTFVFKNVTSEPVPSLLRDFSAPVKLQYDYSAQDLSILMQHDPDAFVRWEAAQLLAQNEIMTHRQGLENGQEMRLGQELSDAFKALLNHPDGDPALMAEAMKLPGEDYLAEQMAIIDVEGIHRSRKFVKQQLSLSLRAEFQARYDELNMAQPYDKSPESMARRSLKNLCLSYLVESPHGEAVAVQQFADSDNMTDSLAALAGLVYSDSDAADQALSEFENRWKDDPLVMDKWFSLQATRPGKQTLPRVVELMSHAAFSMTNPNKVRSLVGTFATANPIAFHDTSGAAYAFIADQVIELNQINPQIAARMVAAFNRWKRFDGERRELMKKEMERIAAVPELSSDVAEIVGNALR
jgi:aminopeptidase N